MSLRLLSVESCCLKSGLAKPLSGGESEIEQVKGLSKAEYEIGPNLERENHGEPIMMPQWKRQHPNRKKVLE